jgi:hypothetical protein
MTGWYRTAILALGGFALAIIIVASALSMSRGDNKAGATGPASLGTDVHSTHEAKPSAAVGLAVRPAPKPGKKAKQVRPQQPAPSADAE